MLIPVSLVAAYKQARIPVTVHLAIGTDIPHMHRAADGAALALPRITISRLFCALVEQMHPGGVYLNWGSRPAPRVFLKAVSVVRNLGVPARTHYLPRNLRLYPALPSVCTM